jgi:hypothetical protein
MVDVNYGKFRIFTFAGSKDKSFEDAGYRLIPFGYACERERERKRERERERERESVCGVYMHA